MLSRVVITFLPSSKCLLISRLQSPSAVILEPQKIKSDTVSTVSPSISYVRRVIRNIWVPKFIQHTKTESLPLSAHPRVWMHRHLCVCLHGHTWAPQLLRCSVLGLETFCAVCCAYLFSCVTLWPYGLQPTRLLHPWDSPVKNTGVGSHALLPEIFPTQGLKPGRLHCRQILN